MKGVKLFALLAAASLVFARPAGAYWAMDGVALCAAPENQSAPNATTDGGGGAIVVWTDYRGAGTDIYARRVNASGTAQWTVNGIAVCVAAGDQSYPAIVSDGAGGAVMVWQDQRAGGYDIYAQRVDASGNVLWAADGVALCAATGTQQYPKMISDGFGGAIVAWMDYRDGNWDIYAQRVNAAGNPVWGGDGIAVCAAVNIQSYPELAADGASGAIIAWKDLRNGSNYDIYARRVDYGGSPLWTADGVAVCNAAGNQSSVSIAGDGLGGAIVAWDDQRSAGTSYLYAQRLSGSGSTSWTVNGVLLCSMFGQQYSPKIVSDGIGGAIAVWMDYRASAWDIYAQRVNKNGVMQWGASGLAVCTEIYDQENPEIISDGEGGAIMAWQDERDLAAGNDVYAQRVDALGTVQWEAGGFEVSGLIADQNMVKMVSDEGGGAIMVWHDKRTLESDIYAQWIDAAGGFGSLVPRINSVSDVPGDEGGVVYVSWGAVRPDLFMDPALSGYSVWRAIDPARAAAILDAGASLVESLYGFAGSDLRIDPGRPVVRMEKAAGLVYYWELVETTEALHTEGYGKTVATLFDSSGVCDDHHYFQVVAHTTDPMVFWPSAVDSGYSIDNLAPCAPLYLAGEQSYSPEGLSLTWNRNAAEDLFGYRLYRGLSADFLPSPRNMIGAPCDTVFFDGGWEWSDLYYYKVSAVDLHGNESGCALLAPEVITDDEIPEVPGTSYLSQNCPNPFNPSTRVEYGLVSPERVSLRIYDASGRLVRTLVDGGRDAGRHVETWDGRNMKGETMASGVYFYRLVAGDFTRTRKMILLR